jgi:very-short-patch-repair endonuclease
MLYQNPKLKTLRRKLRKKPTDAEYKMWQALRKSQIMGLKFIRQYSVGKYVLDFYCPLLRLAIELDGGQHLEQDKILYDTNRTKFLNKQNITVLRFYNTDVFTNLEGAIDKVIEVATSIISPPNLPLH